MTSKLRNEVVWIPCGWLPISLGFCPSKKAWKTLHKSLELTCDAPYPNTAGAMTRFETDKGPHLIVTLDDETDTSAAPYDVVGMLVHEGTHVWQHIKDIIGEDQPSKEFEAYSMQHIVSGLLRAHEMTRKVAA
jgi:hypothetical protein